MFPVFFPQYCQRKYALAIASMVAIIFLCAFGTIVLSDIETAILEKNYEKAGRLAQAFIEKGSPRNQIEEARYYLGLSSLEMGQYTQARDAFEYVVHHTSAEQLRDRAYLGLTDAFFQDGHYEEAAAIFEKFIKLSPRSDFLALAYLKGARTYMKLARWQEADEYLQKIVNQYPGSPEVPMARQFLEEQQYFAVQVGAFLERERAESLAAELQDKGEYAYVVETSDARGRKFYRVRVGKLALLKEAESLKARLSRLGYPTAIYP